MFAVFKTKNIRKYKNREHFLCCFGCCYLQRYEAVQIPWRLSILYRRCSWSNKNGRRAAFFILLKFQTPMTKNDEICSGCNYCTLRATVYARQAYSGKTIRKSQTAKFRNNPRVKTLLRDVEKILFHYTQKKRYPVSKDSVFWLKLLFAKELKAKNRAHDFILKKGLIAEFSEFY